MKCKRCGYQHGWDPETMKQVDGKDGDFFMHPVSMERERGTITSRRTVMGCPQCGALFMDTDP